MPGFEGATHLVKDIPGHFHLAGDEEINGHGHVALLHDDASGSDGHELDIRHQAGAHLLQGRPARKGNI